MVSQRYRKWLFPATVLIVALIVVLGDLAAWRYLGWPDVYTTLIMNGAVAMGTLSLAVVAWIENQNTVRQMEIDRTKPGILALVAYWIDALHEALDADRDRFMEQDAAEPIDFPHFAPITDPFFEAPIQENELPDRIVQEIGEEYRSISEDFDSYDELAAAYQDARQDLKSELEDYFEHDFVHHLESQEVRDDIQQYLDNKDMSDYSPEEYLTSNLNSFANTVFTGRPDAGSYTEGYWDHVPETPTDVRSRPQFGDAFSGLKTKYKKLRNLNTRMTNRLNDARERFKNRYDIVESEVVELKSGISRY